MRSRTISRRPRPRRSRGHTPPHAAQSMPAAPPNLCRPRLDGPSCCRSGPLGAIDGATSWSLQSSATTADQRSGSSMPWGMERTGWLRCLVGLGTPGIAGRGRGRRNEPWTLGSAGQAPGRAASVHGRSATWELAARPRSISAGRKATVHICWPQGHGPHPIDAASPRWRDRRWSARRTESPSPRPARVP